MRDLLSDLLTRTPDRPDDALPQRFKPLKRAAKAYVAERHRRMPVPVASRFELDLGTGALDLRFEGRPALHLVAQVAGTYVDEGSFCWGWDHPSVPDSLQQAAWVVQRHGTQHGIRELQAHHAEISQKRAETFMAITAYLARADGVFMGDHGGGGSICLIWYRPDSAGLRD